MSAGNKITGFLRNTEPARLFVPVGIALMIFGVILLGFRTDKYAETAGEILSVTECPTAGEDHAQENDVKVKYQVDGKDYETTFSNITGSYKTGGSIKVYYDPDDPQKTTNSKLNGFIAPVMIGLGAAALIFGIGKTAASFRKSKEADSSSPDGIG